MPMIPLFNLNAGFISTHRQQWLK